MAFEVPIEADRPGDAGFLSSFIKAPIVGLMWIFGGKEAEQLVEQTQRLSSTEENSEDCQPKGDTTTLEDDADEIMYSVSAWECQKNQGNTFILLDEGRPGTVSSDTSEDGDGDFEERMFPEHMSEERIENESGEPSTIRSSRKRQNSISWSDESGQSLVFYCDEVSSKKGVVRLLADRQALAMTDSVCLESSCFFDSCE